MGQNKIFTLAMLCLHINFVASLKSSTDEYALLAFKSQITSDPNNILAKNWSQGTPFCNWVGITCGRIHQRVRKLNIADMGVGGTIAKEIGELSFLRSLIISNNNFLGFIPDEIGNLSQLQEIKMQYNELNGRIPTSLGFLENLRMLNLSHNRLYGAVPNRIFNLSLLTRIDLKNNSLSGSLSTDMCNNLPNMELLRISFNQISGNIPPSLGTCGKLQLLSLAFNNFSGSIPLEIGNLSKLQHLYLRGNNLIEYGSTGLISTMADVYSYGIMLMETFTKKKPTSDMFVGVFTMRKWVFESLPDAIMQIVDVDLVNPVEDNIQAKEICFRSIMGLALECTANWPNERLNMKDVVTRLKKIKTEFCKA